MIFYFFGFCFFVVLIVAGAAKSRTWESSMHMINVEWLDHPEKFELIARWGAKG